MSNPFPDTVERLSRGSRGLAAPFLPRTEVDCGQAGRSPDLVDESAAAAVPEPHPQRVRMNAHAQAQCRAWRCSRHRAKNGTEVWANTRCLFAASWTQARSSSATSRSSPRSPARKTSGAPPPKASCRSPSLTAVEGEHGRQTGSPDPEPRLMCLEQQILGWREYRPRCASPAANSFEHVFPVAGGRSNDKHGGIELIRGCDPGELVAGVRSAVCVERRRKRHKYGDQTTSAPSSRWVARRSDRCQGRKRSSWFRKATNSPQACDIPSLLGTDCSPQFCGRLT